MEPNNLHTRAQNQTTCTRARNQTTLWTYKAFKRVFKGIFQKGVYGWLPLNGFSKAFKRSLVISTAGLGVIFTAGLGVIFTAGLGVIFTAGLGVIFTAGRGVIFTAGLGIISTAGLGVIFTAGLGVIFTAGLGVIVTSWRLGLIKPYMAFQGLLIDSMYYI